MEQQIQPTLNDYQQTLLWESLVGAKTRAQYFAVFGQLLRKRQRWLTAGALVLSSGAALTLLTSAVPQQWNWVKAALTVVSAVLSAISLVSSNEKNAIEAADLHYRWNTLAISFERLWADMYASDANETLSALLDEEALISKSSNAMPNVVKLMTAAEDNVIGHLSARHVVVA